MNLELIRKEFSDISTIGGLYIDGTWECFILEDVDRLLESGGIKIPGRTAIPRGRYRIVIDWSDRFQQLMPHLLDVPLFTGVRCHPGNYEVETEGCLLPGLTRGIDHVRNSRLSYASLCKKLAEALNRKEEIWIDVK